MQKENSSNLLSSFENIITNETNSSETTELKNSLENSDFFSPFNDDQLDYLCHAFQQINDAGIHLNKKTIIIRKDFNINNKSIQN